MTPLTHYSDSTVAVLGLGISGESVLRALSAGGANVIAWDERRETVERLERESLTHVVYQDLLTCDWQAIDYFVLSAGIPLTHPEPHPVVLKAQEKGCPIICDIELLYNQCPDATYVGITGTNGKSTTTALIGHILAYNGVAVEVGGNIGKPGPSLQPLGKEGVYVIEMSSYQLDLLQNMHFDISVLLNITPDHLDRHGDMEGYCAAKMHIFDRQDQSDHAIIGVDNINSQKCLSVLSERQTGPQLLPISTEQVQENGVTVKGGVVYGKSGKWELGALPRLPGEHNAQNIAVAFSVAHLLGVEPKKIVEAVSSFEGLPHRMQWVDEIDGVTFINDSKATNAEAASKALSAYDSVYWILGGKAKEGGIESLVEFFPRVKKAYLVGEAAEEFAATLGAHQVEYDLCGTLDVAVDKGSKDAFVDGKEAVLLFSPACASFDQWPNFEKRGEAFCHYVNKLKESNAIQSTTN